MCLCEGPVRHYAIYEGLGGQCGGITGCPLGHCCTSLNLKGNCGIS